MIRSVFSWMIERHCRLNPSRPPLAIDVLPWLAASWMSSAACQRGSVRRQLLEQTRVLWQLSLKGAVLLFNLPIGRGKQLSSWVGNRLFFCPDGIPSTPVAVVASSRLARPWDEQDNWFLSLRRACRWSASRHQPVLTVAGTTTTRFLASCQGSLGIQTWQFHFPRPEQALAIWLSRLLHASTRTRSQARWQSWVSPPVQAEPDGCPRSSYPIGDRFQVAAADSLHLLKVRPGGNLDGLIKQRLTGMAPEFRLAGIHISRPAQVPVRIAYPDSPLLAPGPFSLAPVQHISELPASFHSQFLTHWTRPCDGPWPGQAEREWLDQLVLADPARRRSARSVIERIVLMQQIIASPDGIRNSAPVVCMTAVPVNQWTRMRVYRQHRRRWDFLPFAIAMRQDWLRCQGARPVIYGEASDWQDLSPDCQPFFQRARSGKGKKQVDWRREREWRIVGNLDLEELASEDGFILVPDSKIARQLAPLSRWPVLYESGSPGI
ncbi:MAG: hypothetical protein VB855_07305 [Pirellulaceae bacterium]